MSMLARIKKKGMEGFKQFVSNLEGTAPGKRMDIIQAALLEDPVYAEWAMKNIFSIERLLELPTDELIVLCQNLPSGMGLFARAFCNTKEHVKVSSEVLPKPFNREYLDEAERFRGIDKSDELAAQSLLLKTLRDLQNRELLVGPIWHLPPSDVIGESKLLVRPSGVAELKYSTDILAAKGELKNGRRIGHWQHFFVNGKLMAEGNYDNGFKAGEWIFYYLDGTLRGKGPFVGDNKQGSWQERDRNGIVSEILYEDGMRVDKKK